MTTKIIISDLSFRSSTTISIIWLLFILCPGNSIAQTCSQDTSLCYSSEPFPSITFGISQHFQSQAKTVVYQDPLIIDTDGDCIPEIIMSGTTGYTNTPRKTSGITIASSLTGATISSFPTCFYSWTNALAYTAGDINNDGVPELIIAAINHSSNPSNQRGRLICYDLSGNILWISNQQFGLNTTNHYDATPALADFNADGVPEVYAHNQIFNAQTGALLLDGGANGMGINVFVSGICENAISIAGDFDNNPNDLELAAGYTVYDVTITNPNGTTGNTITPYNIQVDGIYRDGFTSMGDINLDGKLDIIVSSSGTETTSRLYAYYLNASMTPVLIAKTAMPKGTTAPYSDFSGPAHIGDLDGNGTPSICVTRNYRMIAYTYNGSNTFQQKWLINTVDQSGCTGITSFDFDQNGIQEIVFRDENNLQIINGNGTTATPISNINCASLTVNDMVLVADIDHSGKARICVTCGSENNANVVIYESNTSNGWAPARGIWNQYAYHVNNISNDGSIPIHQQNNAASELSNNFYVQSTLLDEMGNYLSPACDASIVINCVTNNQINGTLEINYTVSNDPQSSKAIATGCPLSVFGSDPLIGNAPLHTTSINTSLTPGQSYTGTVTLASSLFNSSEVYLLINHNGTSINGSYAPNQFDQSECNYFNNDDHFNIVSASAGADFSTCNLHPITLNAQTVTPYTGTWQVLNGTGVFSDIHQATASFTPSGSQNCILQWTLSQGTCNVSIDQMEVIFENIPLPTLPDAVICVGDSIQMGYSDLNYTYEWSSQNWISNSHVGMPYFFPETTSYVEVTAVNTITGCIFNDTILITIITPPQITTQPDDTICLGQSIQLSGYSSQGTNLYWNGNHPNPYGVTPHAGINQYVVQAISPEGCTSYDTVTIFVYPSPSAVFNYSPAILLNDDEMINTQNHSENADSYAWYVNNQFITNQNNMIFTPSDADESAYYIRLVALNEFGCSDTAVGKITRLTGNFVYVPNAFTPDGSSANNTFFPVFFRPENIKDLKLEIFNRWGELIFKSTNPLDYWDGTYNGKMAPDGIYVWKLHFENIPDGKDVDITGHVNLLK